MFYKVHAKYFDDCDQEFDKIEDFEIEADSEEAAREAFNDMRPSDQWTILDVEEME